METVLDPEVTDFETHLRAAVKAELSDTLDRRIKELPRDRALYFSQLSRLID
jgi:hypothetical protein